MLMILMMPMNSTITPASRIRSGLRHQEPARAPQADGPGDNGLVPMVTPQVKGQHRALA